MSYEPIIGIAIAIILISGIISVNWIPSANKVATKFLVNKIGINPESPHTNPSSVISILSGYMLLISIILMVLAVQFLGW